MYADKYFPSPLDGRIGPRDGPASFSSPFSPTKKDEQHAHCPFSTVEDGDDDDDAMVADIAQLNPLRKMAPGWHRVNQDNSNCLCVSFLRVAAMSFFS